jgi:poly(beta-D-mannuronate) lyase
VKTGAAGTIQSISSATASATPQAQYSASKTIDGILTDESRWSAEAVWPYITFDLGSARSVSSVDIAWAFAASQQTTFDIALSTDGTTYTKIIGPVNGAAQTGYQKSSFTSQQARYVRIIGHYNNNTGSDQWISISEVKIFQ